MSPPTGAGSVRPFGRLHTIEEARGILARLVRGPVEGVETVPLQSATGRVLAADLIATEDVPAFARCAMDGFALRSLDVAGASTSTPMQLRSVGTITAGAAAPLPHIDAGQCVEVATGAPLPPGADCVLMIEQAQQPAPGVVVVGSPLRAGTHVGSAGEDLRAGALALASGTVLAPARLGVLAALGHQTVAVRRRPVALVLPTGDEVAPPGSSRGAHQVYDINSTTLTSLLQQHGCVVHRQSVASDDEESLRAAMHCLVPGGQSRADLLVLSGGTSVGRKDLLAHLLASHGVIHFHGLAIKPGKPMLCGSLGSTLVLAMPGYPTSCLMTAYALALPAVRTLAGLPPREQGMVTLPLADQVRALPDKTQLLPVSIAGGTAHLTFRGSGAITSLSHADGFIEVPSGSSTVEAGSLVRIQCF